MAPPEIDDIGGIGVPERIERAGQFGPLVLDQRVDRTTRPGQQHQLEQECDTQVPDVPHRLREPHPKLGAARRRRSVERSVWSGLSWLDTRRFHETGMFEAADRTVDGRPPHCEDAPEVGVGGELLGHCKSVGRPLGQHTEYREVRVGQ